MLLGYYGRVLRIRSSTIGSKLGVYHAYMEKKDTDTVGRLIGISLEGSASWYPSEEAKAPWYIHKLQLEGSTDPVVLSLNSSLVEVLQSDTGSWKVIFRGLKITPESTTALELDR